MPFEGLSQRLGLARTTPPTARLRGFFPAPDRRARLLGVRPAKPAPSGARYYYRARYYDPKVGRFISEDAVDYGDGRSLYPYVANNPALLTDPSGYVAGGRNCVSGVDRAGGQCPHWVFTEFANLCEEASSNTDAWVRQCLEVKCKRDLMITCNSCTCDLKSDMPAYTPCSDSVVVCTNNSIPVADPSDPPCWKRVIAHEVVVHACRPGGPSVPNHSLNDEPSKRLRRAISCP